MGARPTSGTSVARALPAAPFAALAACVAVALAWAIVGAGARHSPTDGSEAEGRAATAGDAREGVPEDVAALDVVDWAAGAAVLRDLASLVRDGTPCLDFARIEDPASPVAAPWSRFLEDLRPAGAALGVESPRALLDHPAVHERLGVAAIASLLRDAETASDLSGRQAGERIRGPGGSQEAHDRGVDAATARRILAAVPEGRRTEAAALLMPIFLGASREVVVVGADPLDVIPRLEDLLGPGRRGRASKRLWAWAEAGHEALVDLAGVHGEDAVRGALASSSDPDLLTLRLDLRARMAKLFVRHAAGADLVPSAGAPTPEAEREGAVWIVGWL